MIRKSNIALVLFLLMGFGPLVFAQSSTDLSGTWIAFTKEGQRITTYKPQIFVIDGTTIASFVGQRVNVKVDGNRISINNLSMFGTISGDGNRIDWQGEGFWLKESSEAPTGRSNSPAPAASNVPQPQVPQKVPARFDLTGTWRAYDEDGSFFARPENVRQLGETINSVLPDNKLVPLGRIEGSSVYFRAITDQIVEGKIYDDGRLMILQSKKIWVKTDPSMEPAQPVSNEQQCIEAVQGKVAWNRSGDKNWNAGNLRNLCAGVKDTGALIACFESQIQRGTFWSAATSYCKANFRSWQKPGSTVQVSSSQDLSGLWSVYHSDGKVAGKLMRMTQQGSTITFDTGIGDNRSTARIEGDSIDFGRGITAKISKDRRLVWFPNGGAWVKRGN